MSYTQNKQGEIIVSGWEDAIAASPHKGIANMQGVNISTETGEVMCSYSRTQESQFNTNATGTLNPSDSTHLAPSISGGSLRGGVWIIVSASTITGLSNGNYYVLSSDNGFTSIQISSSYNGSATTGLGLTGTASFTLDRNIGLPVASATEKYSAGSTFQYRYYLLDANGLVWVRDTSISTPGVTWFLPDKALLTNPTGMVVFNGWLMVFAGNTIWCKPTVILGTSAPGWVSFSSGSMVSPATSPNPHFAFVGHQGKIYYTDGNFIGSIFPSTSLLTGVQNIQSYASYSAVTTTGTITTLINGSLPTTSTSSIPIPAVFFTDGTKPNALTVGTIYYILYNTASANFQVFDNFAMTNPALDIATGSVGNQYFNTFYPTSAGGKATITFSPQRLNLPVFETATCIAELGNTIIIGCKGNVIYPWNQVDVLPSDIINLPENNVANIITVNNMGYVFAGSKGNIYITNGSTASPAISVPDYTAGIAGTQASYFEPYFIWGAAMYLRGRIYFSILDQTSNKVGNCGGIWSFVPTNNMFTGRDVGMGLIVENQNSYGSYSGAASVLIDSQVQSAISPQYWAGWYSSISSPLYGIDFTNTTTSTPAIIETDLIPTGYLLGDQKKTFQNIEYKLATPLAVGEAVSISYRKNGTEAYTTMGSAVVESATSESGYFTANFENTKWLQLKITLSPLTGATSTFVRLTEVIIR